MNTLFPLDIAFDDAFFNREDERERLKNNIDSNTHTLITSPRRYGKTSLVYKVITELKVAHATMDMMLASDDEKMKNIIIDGIARASTAIASGKTKIIELIKKLFQPFSTIETIELGKLALKFQPYGNKPAHLLVFDALQRLEQLAAHVEKPIILFFDEYQHVLDIKGSIDFEASLRSFAQNSKYVICIFSGSHRHILQAMFNDDSRPFYNMCDHLMLERITAEKYIYYLTKLSKQQWKTALSTDIIDLILDLTACHTYYVNALCRRLWRSEYLPTTELIMQEWQSLAMEKRYEISSDFEKLTPIQRTILIELAYKPFAHPTSKDVTKRLNASLSGIKNAMEGLVKQDYIFRDVTKTYRVLNPLMEYVLRQQVLKFDISAV